MPKFPYDSLIALLGALMLISGGTRAMAEEVTTGSLQVTIAPSEAVERGGRWRVAGETGWMESGETVELPANESGGPYVAEYTVQFSEIQFHITPDPISVTIHPGELTEPTITYQPDIFAPGRRFFSLPGDVELAVLSIPGGTFHMGNPAAPEASNEGPVTTVTLTQDYYLGQFAVTQRQWEAVMGPMETSRPPCFWPFDQEFAGDRPVPRVGDDLPMFMINYAEALAFIDRLNDHLAATGQGNGGHFRLPTEAEWERAAQGGQEYGLHRMAFGVVREWTSDGYRRFLPGGHVVDPVVDNRYCHQNTRRGGPGYSRPWTDPFSELETDGRVHFRAATLREPRHKDSGFRLLFDPRSAEERAALLAPHYDRYHEWNVSFDDAGEPQLKVWPANGMTTLRGASWRQPGFVEGENRIVIRFSRPLYEDMEYFPGISLWHDGEPVPFRPELPPHARNITLHFVPPADPEAVLDLLVEGNGLLDHRGMEVDLNADQSPGGVYHRTLFLGERYVVDILGFVAAQLGCEQISWNSREVFCDQTILPNVTDLMFDLRFGNTPNLVLEPPFQQHYGNGAIPIGNDRGDLIVLQEDLQVDHLRLNFDRLSPFPDNMLFYGHGNRIQYSGRAPHYLSSSISLNNSHMSVAHLHLIGRGHFFLSGRLATLLNVSVEGNDKSSGFSMSGGSNSHIENSTFSNNSKGISYYVALATFINNAVNSNDVGLSVAYQTVRDNLFCGNTIEDNERNVVYRVGTPLNYFNHGMTGNYWSDFQVNSGYPENYLTTNFREISLGRDFTNKDDYPLTCTAARHCPPVVDVEVDGGWIESRDCRDFSCTEVLSHPLWSQSGFYPIFWPPVESASHYELQRRPDQGGPWETIHLGEETSHGEAALPGIYRYRVRACFPGGPCGPWGESDRPIWVGDGPLLVVHPDTVPLPGDPDGPATVTIANRGTVPLHWEAQLVGQKWGSLISSHPTTGLQQIGFLGDETPWGEIIGTPSGTLAPGQSTIVEIDYTAFENSIVQYRTMDLSIEAPGSLNGKEEISLRQRAAPRSLGRAEPGEEIMVTLGFHRFRQALSSRARYLGLISNLQNNTTVLMKKGQEPTLHEHDMEFIGKAFLSIVDFLYSSKTLVHYNVYRYGGAPSHNVRIQPTYLYFPEGTRMEVAPEVPQRGGVLRLEYDSMLGPLAEEGAIWVRVMKDQGGGTVPVGIYPLRAVEDAPLLWEVTLPVPPDADRLLLSFAAGPDGEESTAVDDNEGAFWEVETAGEAALQVTPQSLALAPGGDDGTMTLENRTGQPIAWVASLDGGADWAVVAPAQGVVPPGESRELTVSPAVLGDQAPRMVGVSFHEPEGGALLARAFLRQEGCSIALGGVPLEPFAGGGSSQTVTVVGDAWCAWDSDVAGAHWITVVPPSGTGPGPVEIQVAPGRTSERQHTIRIGSEWVEVVQEERTGCFFTGTPGTDSIPFNRTEYRLIVPFPDGCHYTMTTDNPDMFTTFRVNGFGLYQEWVGLRYGIAHEPRTARFFLNGDHVFTLFQDGYEEYCAADPGSGHVPLDGVTGAGFVLPHTSNSFSDVCGLIQTTDVDWIQLIGNSFTLVDGKRRFAYTVPPNFGPTRSGTITTGQAHHHVTQDGLETMKRGVPFIHDTIAGEMLHSWIELPPLAREATVEMLHFGGAVLRPEDSRVYLGHERFPTAEDHDGTMAMDEMPKRLRLDPESTPALEPGKWVLGMYSDKKIPFSLTVDWIYLEPGTRVEATPASPIGGTELRIRYDSGLGPLAGTETVELHWATDDWHDGETITAMTPVDGAPDLWEATLTVPIMADSIHFRFGDGNGGIDNNEGADWMVEVAPVARLFVSPPMLELNDEADVTSLTIANQGNADMSWSLMDLPGWLTASAETGQTLAGESTVVELTSVVNTSNTSRNAELVIMAEGAVHSPRAIMVLQNAGQPVLEIDPGAHTTDSEADVLTLVVRNAGTGTLEWQATISEDTAPWVEISNNAGTLGPGEETTTTVTILPNPLGLDRMGTVTFTAPETTNRVLQITQDARNMEPTGWMLE